MADISQIQVGSTTYNICDAQSRTNINNLQSTVSGHTTSINTLNTTVSGHTTSINSLNTTMSKHADDHVTRMTRAYSANSSLTGNISHDSWYISHRGGTHIDYTAKKIWVYSDTSDSQTSQNLNVSSTVASIWTFVNYSFGCHITMSAGITCQSALYWGSSSFDDPANGTTYIGNHRSIPIPGSASNVFIHLGGTELITWNPSNQSQLYIKPAFYQYHWPNSTSTVTRDEVTTETWNLCWGHE